MISIYVKFDTLCLQLSKKSFPLCMQNIHLHFRQNHHLRHGSRMQYGLFLKGIGLSYEEAMKYFRMEFTKIMDVDSVSYVKNVGKCLI